MPLERYVRLLYTFQYLHATLAEFECATLGAVPCITGSNVGTTSGKSLIDRFRRSNKAQTGNAKSPSAPHNVCVAFWKDAASGYQTVGCVDTYVSYSELRGSRGSAL